VTINVVLIAPIFFRVPAWKKYKKMSGESKFFFKNVDLIAPRHYSPNAQTPPRITE
jgi:hypothetical protein